MQMENYRAKHAQLNGVMTIFQRTQIFVLTNVCSVLVFHNPQSETLNRKTSMNFLQTQSDTSPCLLKHLCIVHCSERYS